MGFLYYAYTSLGKLFVSRRVTDAESVTKKGFRLMTEANHRRS